jgi:glycosyltransferase involved in cell wall biosynthesis
MRRGGNVKILVISAAFPPNQSGEATNAYHLCRRLADRGLDVHVLTSVGHTASLGSRITVHPVMRRWSWAEAPRLRRFLKQCAPDAIYLMYLGWTYDFQFMSTFIPTIAKRVLPTVPFVTRFENIGGAGPQTNSLASRIIRKALASFDRRGHVDYHFGTLLRDSDTIVLLSGRHQAVLERHFAEVGRKCALIPPPANMCMSAADVATRERGRQALGAEPGDFLLAYIGFVYPGKGIAPLLRGFQQIALERNRVKLVVIGGSLARQFPDRPNYQETMQALSTELGLDGKVIWTGEYRWDDDLASAYLRAADACVLPFETGVKLNNSSFSSAAAHGLPIVTTKDEAIEPQFVHRENVFLCQPASPEALAGAIREVMDDAGLRGQLGRGALQLARDWYSWETAIDKTLSLMPAPRRGLSLAVPQSVN